MQDPDRNALVIGQLAQGLGAETGGAQRVGAFARTGIGNQDHVARIEITPVAVIDRGLDPGVGILAVVTAGNTRRFQRIHPGKKFFLIRTLLQVDEGTRQVIELRHLLQVVTKRGQTEVDLVVQPVACDGAVDLARGFARAVDVRTHGYRRIYDKMNTAAVTPLSPCTAGSQAIQLLLTESAIVERYAGNL